MIRSLGGIEFTGNLIPPALDLLEKKIVVFHDFQIS